VNPRAVVPPPFIESSLFMLHHSSDFTNKSSIDY